MEKNEVISSARQIREYRVPFAGLTTYVRTVGTTAGDKKPLLLLHGGPGSTHNYFEVLDRLADDGRMIVSYDQIGCGESPADGRTDLFNRETWLEELDTVRKALGLDEVHILGQSWGGMLLLEYLCRRAPKPQGVVSAVLSSTLPSSALWSAEQHRMIRELPEPMRLAIAEADRTGDYSSPEYAAANDEFMFRHCGPKWGEDAPECLRRPKKGGTEAYITAWGPNEFTPLGNLRDYDVTALLPGIRVPTLITSGVDDMCTPLIAKTMHDAIPGSRWELFAHSRHMAYAEENEKYVSLLRLWLASAEQ